MMSEWVHYLGLTIRARTGLSPAFFAWALVAALAALFALAWLAVAAYVAVAERYGAQIASLAVGGFFVAVAIIAALSCLAAQRRAARSAERALDARGHAIGFDPAFITLGMQIGRAVGWRRVVPLAAVGIIAAGVAREWIGSRPGADK